MVTADERAGQIAELIRPLRVKPGTKVNLARDFGPGYRADFLRNARGGDVWDRRCREINN